MELILLQGFCIHSDEVSSEETSGTEFVDMAAGGFDDGQGNENVSSQVETDNLVSNRLFVNLYVHMMSLMCHVRL